jgi:hypothetical protein
MKRESEIRSALAAQRAMGTGCSAMASSRVVRQRTSEIRHFGNPSAVNFAIDFDVERHRTSFVLGVICHRSTKIRHARPSATVAFSTRRPAAAEFVPPQSGVSEAGHFGLAIGRPRAPRRALI